MDMSAVLTGTVMTTEGLLAKKVFRGMDVLGARAKTGALAYIMGILVDTGVTFTSVLKSPEKLFATLDMYEVTEELLTQVSVSVRSFLYFLPPEESEVSRFAIRSRWRSGTTL
ncbi:hypothetical protein CLOM_g16199 [Closterium sp. NIES-68]|nr:hypothetical protein CLOM_g16199 [Closterium sp. NIES-68]